MIKINITFQMLMEVILDYLLKEREIIPTEGLANKIKRDFIKQYELTEEELENIKDQSFDRKLKSKIKKVCNYFREYGIVLQLDDNCFRVTELASKLKEDHNIIDRNAVVLNREIHHNLYAKITGDKRFSYEDNIVSLLDMDIVEETNPAVKEKEGDTIPLI